VKTRITKYYFPLKDVRVMYLKNPKISARWHIKMVLDNYKNKNPFFPFPALCPIQARIKSLTQLGLSNILTLGP